MASSVTDADYGTTRPMAYDQLTNNNNDILPPRRPRTQSIPNANGSASTPSHNAITSINANERTSLLPKHNNPPTDPDNNDAASARSWSLKSHLSTPLSRHHADLLLLFNYIVTGLLDSTATAVWGSFVSMQTGNTIYVGLGLASPTTGTRWIKSGLSILGFCFGSFCFSRFHRAFGGKSMRIRWVVLVSVLMQMLLIVAAAIIVTLYPPGSETAKSGGELSWTVLVPLGVIAFHSAGQAVISRAVQFGTLTSVVLTSIYLDLFSDSRLFAGLTQNVDRNRRGAAPCLLLLGALIGGFWDHSEVGMMGALWLAAGLKGVSLVAWMFWAEEEGNAD